MSIVCFIKLCSVVFSLYKFDWIKIQMDRLKQQRYTRSLSKNYEYIYMYFKIVYK